jgi:hypothetical protein
LQFDSGLDSAKAGFLSYIFGPCKLVGRIFIRPVAKEIEEIFQSCVQMKKGSLLLLSIFCISEIVFAQKTPKFSAAISFGPAFPVGKFGSKNSSDSTAGWALPGPALNVSFGYHLTKSTGAMLLMSGQFNKQDANSFNKRIKENNPPGTEVQTKTYSWNIWKIMAGGFFDIPISNSRKVLLRTALSGGAVKSYFPGYKYSGTSNPTGSPADQSAFSGSFSGMQLPWVFGFQVNSGVQYEIAENIFLLADLNYFNAEVESYSFYPRGTGIIFSPGPVLFPPPQKTKFSLASLNVMFGAEFRF